ncbi:MAG TPA: TlyA family RNA methyltransferase [Candidatus Saccharimonadales bacterium]|jgi:23S rRNA (cytidine1920-2'-O)/16S rRNA (cytidine1409-2'-O)-methyltransferase|nr:TlyA family RNA methyltransferase [Candidatus Saccharimonadales bacterium]
MAERRRLDVEMTQRGLVPTRSQAESWIRMGKVQVDGVVATKPGTMVVPDALIELTATEQYVSRAGLKLASVAKALHIDFADKVVLDVGSSTGGFTDYALQHGARKVIAVDVGTDQLHPSLHDNPKIELHEQTDIRNVMLPARRVAPRSPSRAVNFPAGEILFEHVGDEVPGPALVISEAPDVVVMDVSFISLREILPHVAKLCGKQTKVAAMLKPQFEAGSSLKHKGVIKNDAMRRQILKDFESWVRAYFVVVDKADSEVAGSKGNRERFYLLVKS